MWKHLGHRETVTKMLPHWCGPYNILWAGNTSLPTPNYELIIFQVRQTLQRTIIGNSSNLKNFVGCLALEPSGFSGVARHESVRTLKNSITSSIGLPHIEGMPFSFAFR